VDKSKRKHIDESPEEIKERIKKKLQAMSED